MITVKTFIQNVETVKAVRPTKDLKTNYCLVCLPRKKTILNYLSSRIRRNLNIIVRTIFKNPLLHGADSSTAAAPSSGAHTTPQPQGHCSGRPPSGAGAHRLKPSPLASGSRRAEEFSTAATAAAVREVENSSRLDRQGWSSHESKIWK